MTTNGNLCIGIRGLVVEAYRLDRYDNFLDEASETSEEGCRSLSFG